MKQFKDGYGFILKNIKKDLSIIQNQKCIKNKTFVIAGGTRGIGYSIAEHLVQKGANVALLGKTKEPHPKLENTIDSAVEKLNKIQQSRPFNPQKRYEPVIMKENAVGIICDVRDFESLKKSKKEIIHKFGSIDGLVINASALCLNSTLKQSQKEIDLMTGVNIKGCFNVGQIYLEAIKNTSNHPHVLIIAPPIEMLYNDDWWAHHLYYSISKFNMSLMAKFWNKEFPEIGVNTLWPRTTIDTAPVINLLGGEQMVNISRKPSIMGTAGTLILSSDPKIVNGKNFIDDEVIISAGLEVEQFKVNPDVKEKDLMPDFFC